jgi:hypothetical protein
LFLNYYENYINHKIDRISSNYYLVLIVYLYLLNLFLSNNLDVSDLLLIVIVN